MDQMPVYIEQDGPVISFVDNVVLEDLVVKCPWWGNCGRHLGCL